MEYNKEIKTLCDCYYWICEKCRDNTYNEIQGCGNHCQNKILINHRVINSTGKSVQEINQNY